MKKIQREHTVIIVLMLALSARRATRGDDGTDRDTHPSASSAYAAIEVSNFASRWNLRAEYFWKSRVPPSWHYQGTPAAFKSEIPLEPAQESDPKILTIFRIVIKLPPITDPALRNRC